MLHTMTGGGTLDSSHQQSNITAPPESMAVTVPTMVCPALADVRPVTRLITGQCVAAADGMMSEVLVVPVTPAVPDHVTVPADAPPAPTRRMPTGSPS